jgi:acetophenone carboxylase
MSVQPFKNGETFYVAMGGGAGYGDVLERDPALVMEDMRNGMCTSWAAMNIYKVAFDQNSFRLDSERTETLRREAGKERLKRGKKYDEFEREWSKLSPPDNILEYYGTYPHPKDGRGRQTRGA